MSGFTDLQDFLWKEMVFDALVKNASIETTSARKVVDDIEQAVKTSTFSSPNEIYDFVRNQLLKRGFNFAIQGIRFKSHPSQRMQWRF